MTRRLWWAGVVTALVAIVAGAVVGYRGYVRSERPEQVVRAYYAALARGDAPSALGYGAVPSGLRTYLTSAVLAEQQRIAPITGVAVSEVQRNDLDATVRVRYLLGFADRAAVVTDSLRLRATGRTWRLERVAIPARLRPSAAADRIEFAGGVLPTGDMLLFPGALPVRFDTDSLRVRAGHDALSFGQAVEADLPIELTPAGQRAAQAAVFAALASCLSGRGPVTCPLPDDRYVPGSLRGTIVANQRIVSTLGTERAGVVEASASISVDARYRRLTFQNVAVRGSGRLSLPVSARLYAARPRSVVWSSA